MKKTLLFTLTLILFSLSLSACGSSLEHTLANGNESFNEQNYDQAIETYSQTMDMAPKLAEPIYNLANTLYRMGALEETTQVMGQALELASAELRQHGFYNLGNNFFQQEQMEEAIGSYKEALRINPEDMDAKHNLELALHQKEEQEKEEQEEEEQKQEEEENQSDEEQDQENQQDSQEEDKNGEESQENEASQEEEGENQENANQNSKETEEEQEQNGEGQPQQAEGLTEEQARQILAAVGESTQTLGEKLQEAFAHSLISFGKDW